MGPSPEQEKFQAMLEKIPAAARSSYAPDNEGNLVFRNRAHRRKFAPSDPDKTKSTWKRQLLKELKRKRKLGRK